MPKTTDAFALRRLAGKIAAYETARARLQKKHGKKLAELNEYSDEYFTVLSRLEKHKAGVDALSDAVDDEFNQLVDKGMAAEPDINSAVDRIGSIEQSIRRLKRNRGRVNFLIERLENHCRRLLKYRTCCEPFTEKFERATRLENQYLIILSNLKSFRKLIKTILDANVTTLKRAFNEEFGNRLRVCRKRTKKTQDDVAKFLGVTKAAYAHYETGRNEIPSLSIYRLANFFGVSADYLLGLQKGNDA